MYTTTEGGTPHNTGTKQGSNHSNFFYKKWAKSHFLKPNRFLLFLLVRADESLLPRVLSSPGAVPGNSFFGIADSFMFLLLVRVEEGVEEAL
mmetsp:Transcript_30595/g.91472  ORF Transcript_30595/g.91472 Transcript_30595/m.91472 type:complete len:92 (+) Transcript_30595:122-397(+)